MSDNVHGDRATAKPRIGGVLILYAIAIGLSPILPARAIYVGSEYGPDGLLISGWIGLGLTLATCWLFFAHSRWAPRMIIGVSLSVFLLSVWRYLNMLVSLQGAPSIFQVRIFPVNPIGWLIVPAGAFQMLIWVPYFAFSKRVKATFSKRRSAGQEESGKAEPEK